MLVSDFFQLVVEDFAHWLWSCDQCLIKQKVKVTDFQTIVILDYIASFQSVLSIVLASGE